MNIIILEEVKDRPRFIRSKILHGNHVIEEQLKMDEMTAIGKPFTVIDEK